MVAKIVARDITVDAVPMISDEVILVKISHKRYPEIKPMMVSAKIYAAPLPMVRPPKKFTSNHIQIGAKYSILSRVSCHIMDAFTQVRRITFYPPNFGYEK